MNIELEFLEEVRNFHKINNQIMELNPVIFLDRDNAPADELIEFENLKKEEKLIFGKIFLLGEKLNKNDNQILGALSKSPYQSSEEMLERMPTTYSVAQDLRKLKSKSGEYKKHLLIQVNGELFKIKSPIHQMILAVKHKWQKGKFHFEQALDYTYKSEVFNPNEDFPNYPQGMKQVFKSKEEIRFRDLVLESLGDGMYRLKIDIWFLNS